MIFGSETFSISIDAEVKMAGQSSGMLSDQEQAQLLIDYQLAQSVIDNEVNTIFLVFSFLTSLQIAISIGLIVKIADSWPSAISAPIVFIAWAALIASVFLSIIWSFLVHNRQRTRSAMFNYQDEIAARLPGLLKGTRIKASTSGNKFAGMTFVHFMLITNLVLNIPVVSVVSFAYYSYEKCPC
jgi:hypothetical protein